MSSAAPRIGRTSCALATVAIVAALLGPAPSAWAARAASKSTTTTKPSIQCTSSQLSFSHPQAVSAVTGEDAFTIAITNVSDRRCQVRGYPTVRFYTSAGRLLTFVDRHTSLYFKRQTPRTVSLAPGGHAYFKVAKYRCDVGQRYVSSFFYLLAPGTSGSPWVDHASGGAGVMAYCQGSSRGPGQMLGISPVDATRAQLSA